MAYQKKRKSSKRRPVRKARRKAPAMSARRPVARRKSSKRSTSKRIGSMSRRSSLTSRLIDRVVGSVASGAGQYAAEMVAPMLPFGRNASAGVVAGGGVLLGVLMPKSNAMSAAADGMGGAGVRMLAMGLLAPGGVQGIGRRRRLTEREVKLIEQAAASTKGVGGQRERTLAGAPAQGGRRALM